ncbi:hypothetical protein SARC_09554 [Sphaeroforma arctica JP610]|uniref:Uncharacterized protein n=1 Tax=Sphaeroforma arctica JP610 TaxID=667725 RepID=A0A0L0FMM2_9EUKA|nr:hypothetical protein SARC_09554 [Sphaeroforma arctica JP610]KNC78000.1 hypothetical protein SARC_09554 [Sphaeroforma arctica JP610]|eukprot:XP_014151902.1 hypothetical protein SARC_09554 [Sphaeroforma arctica JP610]
MLETLGATAKTRYGGPPLQGIDGMGTLSPKYSVPWDDLEAYMVILGGAYALAEGYPFNVVDDIPMGCDILIGYDQMRHCSWALMWREDELVLVPQSAIKWSWLKDTNVLLSPQVKLLLGFRQPKPRARGKKAMKKRHKPRRNVQRLGGGANERQDHAMNSDDSAEPSQPQQYSGVDSASEVFTDDDE